MPPESTPAGDPLPAASSSSVSNVPPESNPAPPSPGDLSVPTENTRAGTRDPRPAAASPGDSAAPPESNPAAASPVDLTVPPENTRTGDLPRPPGAASPSDSPGVPPDSTHLSAGATGSVESSSRPPGELPPSTSTGRPPVPTSTPTRDLTRSPKSEQHSSSARRSRNALRGLSIQEPPSLRIPLLSIDVLDLRNLATEFLESNSDSVLSAPAAGFAKALEVFAVAEPKNMAASASNLKAAASTLCKAAAHGKLPVEAADSAKMLASQAMRLVTEVETRDPFFCWATISSCCCCLWAPVARRCWPWCCNDTKLPLHRRDLDRQELLLDKRSALYCLSMPASLALLPYLATTIPEDQHMLMAYIFGMVFATASVGLVLSLHPLTRFDQEAARALSRLSFLCLSILVVMYVNYALSPGKFGVLGVCSGILAVGHVYVWVRSCYSRVDDPSYVPEQDR